MRKRKRNASGRKGQKKKKNFKMEDGSSLWQNVFWSNTKPHMSTSCSLKLKRASLFCNETSAGSAISPKRQGYRSCRRVVAIVYGAMVEWNYERKLEKSRRYSYFTTTSSTTYPLQYHLATGPTLLLNFASKNCALVSFLLPAFPCRLFHPEKHSATVLAIPHAVGTVNLSGLLKHSESRATVEWRPEARYSKHQLQFLYSRRQLKMYAASNTDGRPGSCWLVSVWRKITIPQQAAEHLWSSLLQPSFLWGKLH